MERILSVFFLLAFLAPSLCYADCSAPPATREGERGGDYVQRYKEWCDACGTFVTQPGGGYRCDRNAPSENPFVAPDDVRERSREIRAENAVIHEKNKAIDLYNKGNKLFRAEEFEKALDSYLASQAIWPDRADTEFMIHRTRWKLYIRAGVHEGKEGRPAAALALFEKARAEDTEKSLNTQEFIDWVHSLEEEQKVDAELAKHQRNFDDAKPLIARASADYDAGEWAAAEAGFRAILEKLPLNGAVWGALADSQFQQGKLAEAEANYLQAIRFRLKPTSDDLVSLARIQTQTNRDDEAEVSYREALQLDPSRKGLADEFAALRERSGVGSGVWLEKEHTAVAKSYNERAQWRAEVQRKLETLQLPKTEPRAASRT